MMMGFRDLKIWQKSYQLAMRVYVTTSKFPKDEKYGLTDQIRRAAVSVGANIAEAHGRFHYADKFRVLFQARGECEEVRSHLSMSFGLNYLEKELFTELDHEYNGLGAGINGYISSIKDLTIKQ